MDRNCKNSLSPPRSKPSATFDMMEIEALRIWSRKPKSLANAPFLEAPQTSRLNSRAFCQIIKSSNRSIFAMTLDVGLLYNSRRAQDFTPDFVEDAVDELAAVLRREFLRDVHLLV